MIEKNLIDYYQSQIDNINNIQKDISAKLTDLIKHTTTISFGMLTILVTFKPSLDTDNENYILFIGVLVLLGLNVITGILYIFCQIILLNKQLKFQTDSFNKRLRGDLEKIYISRIKEKWHIPVIKYLFYFSFLFSIIILIIYGTKS